MRRLDKEIKEENILQEILDKSAVVRIGFAKGDIPYIIPLNYAHEAGKLFIHSAPDGKKIKLIRGSDQVCFEMELYHDIIRAEKPCNWTTKYRSVIGYGSIRVSTDRDDKIHGLDLIMRKYENTAEEAYNEAMLKEMVMIIITIQHLTGKQSGNWE